MGNFHHRALMVFASFSAYAAPALMIVCLLTDYWIHGKQTRLSTNPVVKAGDIRVLNFTYHRIGLWRECFKETVDIEYTCEIVKYSKTEAKLEKGFKAVAYRSAPSMVCFTAASALLSIAIFLFTRGLCKRRRKAVFFISGLLFSISGLLTMVGVTLYVSITTEESVKIDQDFPVMKCSYGFSFLCAVFSFVLQELTGVLTVYWFIYRFRALVRKQEKLRERTRQMMGNCLSMSTALPMNLASLSPTNHHGNAFDPRSAHLANQNHCSMDNHLCNPYLSNPLLTKQQQQLQQRRRIPFDKSYARSFSPVCSHQANPIVCPPLPPRSPTFVYGDYCRVLIRTEDVDLLRQMVKSKSQAQLTGNSRPATPVSTMHTKVLAQSQPHRSANGNPRRRSSRKAIKRTTSV